MLKQEQHSSTGSGPPHVVAAAAPDALTAHKHKSTIVKSFQFVVDVVRSLRVFVLIT